MSVAKPKLVPDSRGLAKVAAQFVALTKKNFLVQKKEFSCDDCPAICWAIVHCRPVYYFSGHKDQPERRPGNPVCDYP